MKMILSLIITSTISTKYVSQDYEFMKISNKQWLLNDHNRPLEADTIIIQSSTQSQNDGLNILFVLPHNKGILAFSNITTELIPFENACVWYVHFS